MIHAYRERTGAGTGKLWETGTETAITTGAAGSVAAVATTPIDVVKTRIMLAASDSGEDRQRAVKEMQAQGKEPTTEMERGGLAARGG